MTDGPASTTSQQTQDLVESRRNGTSEPEAQTQTPNDVNHAASADLNSGGFNSPIAPTDTARRTGTALLPTAAASDTQEVAEVQSKLHHTNPVIDAALARAKDEAQVQNLYQLAQAKAGIWNPEIDPEHDGEWTCNCPTHDYMRAKWNRRDILKTWNEAVKYPGEKTYDDLITNASRPIFSDNPYAGVPSPYGILPMGRNLFVIIPRPRPDDHEHFLRRTIAMNGKLDKEAQAKVDGMEPKENIWTAGGVEARSVLEGDGYAWTRVGDEKQPITNRSNSSQPSSSTSPSSGPSTSSSPIPNPKRGSGIRKLFGLKSPEQKSASKAQNLAQKHAQLRNAIVSEETGRWPTPEWRTIVNLYQQKTGIARKVRELRMVQPLQYLHLLCAGYFEPIPVSWATMNGSPLKFTIEASAGWRGITPQWRGYESTGEERLYWVLNHREDADGNAVEARWRLKPDFMSTMDMARERMAKAVELPPEYFSEDDTCAQEGGGAYSRQVVPAPFHTYDRQQLSTDDTMILLDVSASMDYTNQRPKYEQYLITDWEESTQPKNKNLARAIIRRFTDAMMNRDGLSEGYDLVTFSSHARYVGKISHNNFADKWDSIRFGGNTRVMLGWQRVKDLHFRKYKRTATHHPVLGWQAGPDTPMLRLLLLLDGEANDMDEFELDLLGLDWAHVTIFLIGVDGCPHHHRHANELQRISNVNHHVSFVDAQGNTPERYVTHELLKRHLGYDISLQEFQAMEVLPEYSRSS